MTAMRKQLTLLDGKANGSTRPGTDIRNERLNIIDGSNADQIFSAKSDPFHAKFALSVSDAIESVTSISSL
jgi:hypothetical protein